jgi:FixJ family two-component response regulator
MIATVCRSRIVYLSRAPLVSIVDDDDSVRAAMSSLVRSLGYEACLFASAEAFLASPHLNDTACLIADVQMPGMSGLELQSELQARQSCIPIIFITAFAEDRIRQRAEAAGALGFFSKPVDSRRIIGCLDAALRHEPPTNGAGP